MYIKQVIRTVVYTIMLLFVVGLLRPGRPAVNTGMSPRAFWSNKIAQPAAYDVVLMGDSRTNNGLSPEIMSRTMKGYRIVNFGFWAAGFNKLYLEAAEKRLDPASAKKIILLGITSLSLTPREAADNYFMTLRREDHFDTWVNIHFGSAVAYFDPFKIDDILMAIRGRSYFSVTYNTFYPDGWAALNIIPKTPRLDVDSVNIYKKAFTGNQVSQELMDGVIEYVAKWSRSGVRVFGMHHPASKAVAEVENTMSGYDEPAFIKRFEAAGGKWITYDDSQYITADGSHLEENSARKLSVYIAERIMSEAR